MFRKFNLPSSITGFVLPRSLYERRRETKERIIEKVDLRKNNKKISVKMKVVCVDGVKTARSSLSRNIKEHLF